MATDNQDTNGNKNILNHIAIICDGNRRFAAKQGLSKMMGHKKGLENVETLIRAAKDLGVKTVTFWLLSTENREDRPDEYEYMMQMANDMADYYRKMALDEQARIIHIGRKDRLPKNIVEKITSIEEETKDFTAMNVALAIDYGGRDEILHAIKEVLSKQGTVSEEELDKCLYTSEVGNPDLIIRTGGKKRLSGFMPWQSVYSELYFTDTLFPEFDKEELEKALTEFSLTQRNFGK